MRLGELQPGHRHQHRRSDAAHGRSVARARRVRARSARSGPRSATPSRTFINSFDQTHDRLALLTFGNGAKVLDAMPAGRGFDKAKVMADVPNTLPGGSTTWSRGSIAGGTSCARCRSARSRACASSCCSPTARPTACRAIWDGDRRRQGPSGPTTSRRIRRDTARPDLEQPAHHGTVCDTDRESAPLNPPGAIDHSQPWNNHWTGCAAAHDSGRHRPNAADVPAWAHWMPATSLHTHHRSAGHPDVVSAAGQHADRRTASPQSSAGPRPRVPGPCSGNEYPGQVCNINNAARNLVEIIANAARDDVGDYANPHLHDRHGPAGAVAARHEAGDVREHPQADRQRQRRHGTRTSTPTSSRASTTTRRPPPTSARRSRRCRTRSCA